MPHRLHFTVAEADIDDLGHASNIAYVRWVQEAAIAHSVAVGMGPDAYQQRGGVFVVRRHTLDYLRPLFARDVVVVETRVVSFKSASSERETILVRERTGETAATARTLWAYVDAATGRPARIPADLAALFPLEQPTLRP